MANWFHRLLNPHCSNCIAERQENNICRSCETLQMELERLRNENNRLLDALLIKPKEEVKVEEIEQRAVLPRNIPWGVRKQMLENEDREKAKILKERQNELAMNTRNAHSETSVEALEKELGVS